MKIRNIVFLTIALLIITIISTGAGHGTFLIAKTVYPFTMLIAILTESPIGIVGILIAILQVPIYAYIFFKKSDWKFYLLGLHILAVGITISLETNVFNG